MTWASARSVTHESHIDELTNAAVTTNTSTAVSTSHAKVREANPAHPRWEASDIVLDDQLTLVEPKRVEGGDESGLQYE